MELVLPNALKINEFEKLGYRVVKYIRSHNGKFPDAIRCNKRQFQEYKELFLKHIHAMSITTTPTFDGIPIIIHTRTLAHSESSR